MLIIVKILAAFLHSRVVVSIQGPYSHSDNIFSMLYLHMQYFMLIGRKSKIIIVFVLFFFNLGLRPFQADYFSSFETGQSVGGRKREAPEKKHLAHPQAELGLSHMWPVRGSNPHQTQR